MSDDTLERLVLAAMLNAHSVVWTRECGGDGGQAQGLFPRFGAMFNHGDVPNAVVVPCRRIPTASSSAGASYVDHSRVVMDSPHDDDDDGDTSGRADRARPWLELRSLRPIDPGEEVTITYLDTLYTSYPERSEYLARCVGLNPFSLHWQTETVH